MAKKKNPKTERKYTITYKDTPFTLYEYLCAYDDEEEPDRLMVHMTVIAPESAEPDYLTMTLPFDEIVRINENFEEPEMKYIKAVINAFRDKPQYEKLAFESLDYDECFDMHAFLTGFVAKMKVSYDEL